MFGIIVLAVLLLLATELIKRVIRVNKSALSALPTAGRGASYSRLLWTFPREYRGTITLDLPALHKKLGPLIRIGPNEVSFYSLEVYDTVHKVNSGFKKDPRVYGQFVQDSHPALFSITQPEEHSKRRRLMGQLFSRSKMPKVESLMLHHIDGFVDYLSHQRGIINLVSSCRALEADIISHFSFGRAMNAVHAWALGRDLAMVIKNDEKATWMPMLTSFPTVCDSWDRVEYLVYQLTGFRSSYNRALHEFDEWTNVAWHEAAQVHETSHSSFPNLVEVLVRSGLPPPTALSEAKENLGPGTDTTSGSLAHILFALSWNPQYQEALYQDLVGIGFATDMSTLENVPRLRACIKEGIRWAGTAAAMLPRIVPDGGIELHGKAIPGGTILTSSPIWYLRDDKAFPEPELFDPYRWITDDASTLKEDGLRDRFYIPFSKGANVCMGVHFAYYELFLGLSRILRAVRILPPDSALAVNKTQQHEGWHPVALPRRKEWVAAVPMEDLRIKIVARSN